MAARVNCPTCKNAVDVIIDEDNEPSAWCEECEREIKVAAKAPAPLTAAKVVRRPASSQGSGVPMARSTRAKPSSRQRVLANRQDDDDYDDDEPKSGSPMIWILAGVGALLLLLGLGVSAYFVMSNDGQNDVALNDAPIDDTASDDTARFKPTQPKPNIPNNPKFVPPAPQTKVWTTYPETPDAKEYGFTVKLPGDVKNRQTTVYANQETIPVPIFYTAYDDYVDYRVAVFDLYNDDELHPEHIEKLPTLGLPIASNFQPVQVAGRPAMRATLASPQTGYCVYLQVASRVFVFAASHLKSFKPKSTDMEAFINSVTISFDPKTPSPRTKDIFLKKLASIDSFKQATVGENSLLTCSSWGQELRGTYDPSGRINPANNEKNSGRGTNCRLYKLPDLTVEQQVTLKYDVYDLQIRDEIITTIEAEIVGSIRGTINYYLHTHEKSNIAESTRVQIPVANLKHGDQKDSAPHYDRPTDRVYMVSEYAEKFPTRIPFSFNVQALRQIDMTGGETKNPIFFFGTIHDYKLSSDGKWIYVYIEEANAAFLRNAPGRDANTVSQEGVVIIDADKWEITHTIRDDVNVIEGINLCPLGDNSILLAQILADPSSPGQPHIEMQHLHPDGTSEPIQIILDYELGITSRPNRCQLSMSTDNSFGILGPLRLTGAIRFKLDLEKHVATVTDYNSLATLQKGYVILPDNKRVVATDGTICRTDSFTDRD